jgi:aryl-alcohol dehydrogenase-like predicted oxidoreductase
VRIVVRRYDENADRTLLVDAPKDLYSYEADTVAANIERRQAEAMRWDDTLGNMALLDRWRAEVGLVYDLEKPERATQTITGRPLTVRKDFRMPHLKLPGFEKPISRLIMGAANNNTMPDTSILFDDYFEHGGTTFDTSHGYGNPNGACERHLGTWIRQRGIRDRVVVIEKGANHPNDTPAGLTRELRSGLERLQLDYVDLYMIHRDNEQVSIGEWVEALNENLRAGRMKSFGLSNFSIARLDAFAAYARAKGLASFSAVSNQCSLARVLAPIWNMHLVSSGDPASRAWFERTQTPLLAWSSQARGFFTDRAAPDRRSDADLVRCWYSEDNFARKQRAEELAQRKGVAAINVAVAWVLAQPFPTCAMIGPLNVLEFRSSLGVLGVELNAEEVRWLDLQ